MDADRVNEVETLADGADSAPEDETEPTATELIEQLGRDLGALAVCETRLAASRHEPELRRAARDVATAAVVAVALLAAFALANVAAVLALATAVPGWAAALLIAGAWTAVGLVAALFLRARARRLASVAGDPEEARAEAQRAIRESLERLAPVITREIAVASVPIAGDVASGIVDAGGELLDNADEIVDAITDGVPGGSVVNQIWDVALMPGRYGIRVVTTVLRR